MEEHEKEEFEKIIANNDFADWPDESRSSILTLGDLYEGINILSAAQVDLHHYLRDILEGLRANNQAGYEVRPIPRLKPGQADVLCRIFEDCARFSEQFDVE